MRTLYWIIFLATLGCAQVVDVPDAQACDPFFWDGRDAHVTATPFFSSPDNCLQEDREANPGKELESFTFISECEEDVQLQVKDCTKRSCTLTLETGESYTIYNPIKANIETPSTVARSESIVILWSTSTQNGRVSYSSSYEPPPEGHHNGGCPSPGEGCGGCSSTTQQPLPIHLLGVFIAGCFYVYRRKEQPL